MKKNYYLKGFYVILYFVLVASSHAVEKIYPLPKPKINNEIIGSIKKFNQLLPQKKPKIIEKKITVTEKTSEVETKKNIKKILPKKRPLIYEKKIIKTVKNSEVLNSKDFKLAIKAFDAIKNKKWIEAVTIVKKAKDKKLYRLVYWLYLKKEINNASFYDYVNFIKVNNDYPRTNRLRYLAEHKINFKTVTPDFIIDWFSIKKPFSGYGNIKLGEAHLIKGNKELGSKLIKDGWINARLSKSQLRYFRKKYKEIIKIEDNIKRADWLAYEGKYWDLQRMLKYLPKDETALYRARQLLMSKSYGVDAAISKIPKKFKNDIGLNYDRLKWRRKRGRIDSSLEILMDVSDKKRKLVRPDLWGKERIIVARSLIYKKKYALAYKTISNHSMKIGPNFAECEWLSGWIALSFLDDPGLALKHFENFYKNVGYPISLSRGAYWIAVSNNKLNRKEKAKEWFGVASQFLTTYYGQLAFIQLNNDKTFSLKPKNEFEISKEFKKNFYKNELVSHVTLLKELNKTKYIKDIVKHLSKMDIKKGSEVLAGELSIVNGRYDYAIQIAKQASYDKRFFNKINFPIIETPSFVSGKKMPPPEIVLSVIRQESEFDSEANSYAGAKGLMQIMTYTAKILSKKSKVAYSKKRLTSDPLYNIRLGSYYLAGLLEEYEGSYPFTLAAYNAGPKRVKYWKKINGNPQKNQIDYVNWVELIKFKETRNYVQRVLENINVYRYMLKGEPIAIRNFFEDKTHY